MTPLNAKTWRLFSALLLVVGFSAGFDSQAADNAYPNKPIKILVPFLPGGSVDLVIRLVSEELITRLGRPVIVDNRAGAGGIIAGEAVAKSPADGYTLLFTAPGPLVTTPFLVKAMPYDAETAFAPISLVTSTPNFVTVGLGSPFKSLGDLVAYAKAHPKEVTYGSPGLGTVGHLAGVLIERKLGVSFLHIPYKGFPPMLVDLKTGRLDMMITEAINSVPRVRSGELVALAVTANERSKQLPGVPTFADAGFAEVSAESWYALVAPTGTPYQIRKRIADEIQAILAIPKIRGRLTEMGVEVRGSTPEQLEVFIKAEYREWGDLIRSSGELQ
jgi:tripartite-type tricarboxylate transporter receptor subunit TctC